MDAKQPETIGVNLHINGKPVHVMLDPRTLCWIACVIMST